MEKTRDLVCGMTINPEQGAGVSEYRGKKYYFCDPRCKEAFDKDPERYIKAENITHTRPHPDK